MRITNRQRRMLTYSVTAMLVLAQLVSFIALPTPVDAAMSADPNAEIVYLDANGVIRVYDTQGNPLVQWVSPDGGWDDIVLADFNDDGDREILALDLQGATSTRIAVYDPVVARGATDPNKKINGIPWDLLWETTMPAAGSFVTAGNFDPNIPGDEIAMGFLSGTTSIVQVWNANSVGSDGKPTGRDWKKHIEKSYPDLQYTFGSSGQLDSEGADELILVDGEQTFKEDFTSVAVYRTDADMQLVDEKRTDSDKYRQVAAGQISEGGDEELAAALTTERPGRVSLIVFELNNDELEEDEAWAFAPNPEWLFLADITGNGDKEVFFLRKWPEEEEGPRLIMRDEWGNDSSRNEGLIEWSLMDGGSRNQFKRGEGGDVDGDGRDELILLSEDRIRIYHRPESGNDNSSDFDDFEPEPGPGDNALAVGDLDSIGSQVGPVLAFDRDLIDVVVPAGTVSSETKVNVTNIGTSEGIGISAIIPTGDTWAQVNPTFATTPATFGVSFDATSLTPGVYNTTLTMAANQSSVTNNNFVINLRLTVVPPVLQPIPDVLSFYHLPCENDPCSADEVAERTEPFPTTIHISGTNELAFRAAILGVPAASNGLATTAAAGLSGSITGGEIDANGNIVIYDEFGNSRTLGGDQVNAAATLSTTLLIDPALTWVMSATVDSGTTPANLSFVIDPSILTEASQREYAVVVLVADTRAGTPNDNVTLVPIELANVGQLLWAAFLGKP